MTVSAETIRTVVGIIGNGTALVLFFSPLPTFRRIWKSRSVEQFPAAPYLATLMNCLLWVLYGLPLVHPHSTLVITINGCGLLIELTYVVIYLCFSGRRQALQVLGMLFLEVAFVAVIAVLVLTLFHTHQQRSLVVGVLCVIFGTVMYAAPLSVMREVIKTKSVEFMPFSLSLASFINGACWTAYALIRFDLFITIPNGLGVAFALAQLTLHIIYHKSTVRQMEERKKLENGHAKPNGSHEADLELGTKTNGVKTGSS